MNKFKIWLILLGISLISIDKYTIITNVREYIAIFVEKNISLIVYRVKNYLPLLLINTAQQRELASQNAVLKKQVETYSTLLIEANNKNRDINSIKELNDNTLYSNYKSTVSKIILDVNFFVDNKLLLDAGINKNITTGSAVVNKDGLIGQVVDVNKINSQVMMVTNPDFKIYLQNSNNKVKMLARGGGHGSLVVNYIDKNESVNVGDVLQTTGLDDVYPANIAVAKVTKVFYENNGFNSALCAPVVNFDNLQYVTVIHK